ncbi:RNA polymerase sigma factor [Urbifossiella limnaea]|nr:RNA polymerase sigma factor [Urbifossiella limnaea]
MDPLEHILRRFLADEPYRRLSDDDLWVRFRDHGDEGAFRVLLQRVGGRIYARCRAVLGDDHLAEEAVQETLLALIRHRGRLPTYGAAVAWLYQTATNTARQVNRHRWRLTRREQRKAEECPPESTPAPDLDADARHATLTAALLRLPTAQRRSLELVYQEGMTHAEAAAALGWSRGSVSTCVQRGLGRLRQLLGREDILAVGGVAVLEAALSARSAGLDPPRAAALADITWARAEAGVPLTGGWWMPRGIPSAIGLVVCAGGVAATGAVQGWWTATRSPQPLAPTPAVAAAVEPENLQVKNLRITREEIAPQVRDIFQRFYPKENLVRVESVRAFGSEVEVELRVTPPPPAITQLAAVSRGRYCVFRRKLRVDSQPTGDTRWYWMNPEKPVAIKLPALSGPGREVVIGRDEFAATERLFDRLPKDERAEAALLRLLFGPPGSELLLPARSLGASGFSGRVILAAECGGLYVRDDTDSWRYTGECPGVSPVVADGRAFCHVNGGIWSRLLAEPTAPWVKWCDEPPLEPGDQDRRDLFIAGGRLCMAMKPHALNSRPLSDPAVGWVRTTHPVQHGGFAVVGDFLFGNDGERLFKRPASQLDAAWVPVGPWPPGYDRLVADGDRLLAFGRDPGPIYARPAAALADVPWTEAGRVHDPYKQ